MRLFDYYWSYDPIPEKKGGIRQASTDLTRNACSDASRKLQTKPHKET